MVEPREKPILFSPLMMRRIIARQKTQTRRVLAHANGEKAPDSASYCVGDRLWVRESLIVTEDEMTWRWVYEADAKEVRKGKESLYGRARDFSPPMHMPRAVCRFILPVTDVRIQRLQDISQADCIAEGAEIDRSYRDQTIDGSGGPMVQVNGWTWQTPRAWYRKLWDSLNEKRGYGWDTNPWVVAVTYEIEEVS